MKNMKNISIITGLVLISAGLNAQTPENKETKEVKIIKKTTESTGTADQKENEIKNFRFGLVVCPSMNWYTTEGKIIEKNGIAPKFGGGLLLEFRLAKVAALQSGLQIVSAGGLLKYNNGGQYTAGANTVSYFYNNDEEEISAYKSVDLNNMASHTRFQLNERKYKTTYISIPFLLKLKTREIGAMTYFGQFGLNSFFRWKARANDKVNVLDATNVGASNSKTNINVTKDCSLYAAALNFGLGTEWNLAGTTSFIVGVNYNLGFTNVLKGHSSYLERRFNNDNYNTTVNSSSYKEEPLEQSVKESSLVLTVGVLF